jgi:hypothetical protein
MLPNSELFGSKFLVYCLSKLQNIELFIASNDEFFKFVRRYPRIILTVRQFYSTCHSVKIKYACSNPLQVLHNVQPYIQFIFYNAQKFPNLNCFFLSSKQGLKTGNLHFQDHYSLPVQNMALVHQVSPVPHLQGKRLIPFLRTVCRKISRHCPCPRYAA